MVEYQYMKHWYGYLILALILSACDPIYTTPTGKITHSPTYPTQSANLKLFLTDKPLDNVSEVNVNIDHVELLLEKNGKQARVKIGQDLGTINLLKLRNGILLAISDINIPDQVAVKQIRIILKDGGHSMVRSDNTVCKLKIPSEKQSGIKILLKSSVLFENNMVYAMIVDFDAEKSVVQQGNNSCLLKPVLKLISATRVNADSIDDSGNSNEKHQELVDGTDTNASDNNGFDGDDPNSLPPLIDQNDLVTYF